jgi:mono/diheme cytochrome c family protein
MPADFRGKRPTLEQALQVLRNGVAGTSMVPWTDRLDEEELLAVANYVRQFYQGRNYRAGAGQ